ncbi:hypothetical protein [Commensalibacter papalotli (ex Botero et al. 2024)]|uniref:Uncharacterized protein n=1 Tax=Commensalibacter papalotli (ex Botero et al. 2024) TaxID=2972766 RepID=A0ABM9HRT6_9PROT|nr:hypothetical protein [Commensalibacter papalotli (ex Botero et al. 2024)]CAI3940832.1 unnamed protein product [Commensalibacter papalotli (ex Botero et al. 2024)]CAI3950183.1 unnamed protein product [Commensalibacter papalotli (ex Botero et al. 2024)]
MKRMLFIVLLASVFVGHSVKAKEYKFTSQFTPSMVQWSKGSGTAMVAGMGIYREVDGTMKSCAGQQITYYPYDPYIIESLQTKIRDIKKIKNFDSRMNDYAFKVPCDVNGDFKLTGLPEGKWIFVMNIPVVKNKEDYSSYDKSSDLTNAAGQGNGILYRIVSITAGKVNSVQLVQGDVEEH